jgi:hypothetical protein
MRNLAPIASTKPHLVGQRAGAASTTPAVPRWRAGQTVGASGHQSDHSTTAVGSWRYRGWATRWSDPSHPLSFASPCRAERPRPSACAPTRARCRRRRALQGDRVNRACSTPCKRADRFSGDLNDRRSGLACGPRGPADVMALTAQQVVADLVVTGNRGHQPVCWAASPTRPATWPSADRPHHLR